jgi:hypothetical protein
MYIDKIDQILTGITISNEKYVNVGSAAFFLNHGTFWGGADLVILTEAGNPETQLIQDTDYTLGNEDTDLTDSSGKTVYTTVTVSNTSYQTGALYISYTTLGDYNQAKDINDLNHYLNDGWIDPQENWTYASPNTFTVNGDITVRNRKGDKIKLEQDYTIKYFYIIDLSYSTDSETTMVTVTGGTNYSLAETPIGNNYYSKVGSPQGFPGWFNYTPTLTGFSAAPTNTVYRFCINNNLCIVEFQQGTNGTSNSTAFTATAPVNSANINNAIWGHICWSTVDGGTVLTSPGRVTIGSNSNTITVDKNVAGAAWTGSGGKRAGFMLTYEI